MTDTPGPDVRVLPWADVTARAGLATTIVVATARAEALLAPLWPGARFVREPDRGDDAAADGDPATVIVAGGGALIDAVKRGWRARWPDAELIAVPTIWGSGAEASPVAVWTEAGKKTFALAASLRPTWVAFYPPFAASVTPARARDACGDVWSHTIEGFLSPLADDALRARFAALIARLVDLPIAPDARWFVPGAEAAGLQARASVGLVHGLAHVLEPVLAPPHAGAPDTVASATGAPAAGPSDAGPPKLGHARLCALLLGPVLRWNAATSPKWRELCAAHGLDRARIEAIVDGLGDRDARRALVPAIEASWRTVLRDPCTRTNSALVRPDSLAGLLAEIAA